MSAFECRKDDQVTFIKCPANIDLKIAQDLPNLIQGWIENAGKLMIFDFSNTVDLNMMAYRAFVMLHQTLKKNGSFLASVNLCQQLAYQIHSAGMDSVFNPKSSHEDAYAFAGLKSPGAEPAGKPVIDVNFVNPFIKATLNTLEVQANTKITPGKPRLKTEKDSENIEIAGVISLSSNVFQGTIAICFPSKVFLSIYSGMVGETHAEISKETEDAAGELLNMIFGQAKVELNSKADYQIQKAIPAVVRGAQLRVHYLTRQVAIVLPFDTEHGAFHLEVAVS